MTVPGRGDGGEIVVSEGLRLRLEFTPGIHPVLATRLLARDLTSQSFSTFIQKTKPKIMNF